MILKAIGVFIATAVVDWAWARYTAGVAAKRPVVASVWSAVIVLLGGLTIVAYAGDPVMLLPAMAGAAVGTFFALKFGT